MSQRTAVVTFALPDEGQAFTRLLTGRQAAGGPLAPVSGQLAGWAVTVAFTGVGSGADCHRRLADALDPPPDLLISSGFAGGLRADLCVGDLVLGENVSDRGLADLAARLLAGQPLHRGALTTQPLIAETPAAKAQLAAAADAIAVDMETAWIADACARLGVPMLSLRVVSDAADQAFPVPGSVLFDVARQRPRYLALPLWLVQHPGQIAPFARFVRRLTPARERLAEALRDFLAGHAYL